MKIKTFKPALFDFKERMSAVCVNKSKEGFGVHSGVLKRDRINVCKCKIDTSQAINRNRTRLKCPTFSV